MALPDRSNFVDDLDIFCFVRRRCRMSNAFILLGARMAVPRYDDVSPMKVFGLVSCDPLSSLQGAASADN